MTVEKRKEALSILCEMSNMIGELRVLDEEYTLRARNQKGNILEELTDKAFLFIEDIAIEDGESFVERVDGTLCLDNEKLEKYLMSEQENSIKPTGVEQPTGTESNKSAKQYGGGKTVDIGGNKKSPFDSIEEKLNKIYPS